MPLKQHDIINQFINIKCILDELIIDYLIHLTGLNYIVKCDSTMDKSMFKSLIMSLGLPFTQTI